MTEAAPWASDPVDFGTAPPPAPSGQGDDARPLTIRPRGNGALPTPTAAPSNLQSAAQPAAPMTGLASAVAALPAPAAAATPWASDPVDTDAPSWLDTAKDVAQSAASGVERGAIGALTAPVAIGDALKNGFSWGMDKVLGPKPDQPAPAPGTLDDVAQNLGSYIGPGALTRGLEAVAGPLYVPQTTAGKYAETAGEFIPGAAGGGIPGALKYGVIPGLASEAAGQATAGTPLETPARIIAPLLAGGGIALAGGPGAAGKVLRDAAGPLDPSTLQAAQGLMDTARAQGAPITLTEGLQQVTNGGTRLGALQRVVEQSRGGADTMAKFYADRPAQVRAAGSAAINRVGPVPSDPSVVAPAVQSAAEGVIGDAHAARTAQAAPLYRAAAKDTVPDEHMRGIIDDLDQQIASDKTGLLAGPLGDLRSRLVDRTAKPPQWEADPTADVSVGRAPDRPFAPPDVHDPRQSGLRPTVPRPQSLVNFLQGAGGVRDPGGDLKAMGLDRFPGLVRSSGGLSPDMARQAAAQAGYLGAHIDGAMADTTVNDLLSALENHPHYSVLDDEATHAWDSYDAHRAERNHISGPTSRPAVPPRAPGFADAGPGSNDAASPKPITDIENLDRTRKYFRDRTELPQFAPNAIDKETGARVGRTLGHLDKVMTDASSSYAAAKQVYQTSSRDQVEPLENGIIGMLSRSKDFGTQARIILNPDPLPGSEGEISDAIQLIKSKSPSAAQALVSQRIRQVFNEATQDNMGGPNQWGGAKFNAVIRGNDQQGKNLKAAVEALHGPTTWHDFQRTLDVFEAMGRRQAPGSMTEPNRQISKELQKGGKIGELATGAVSPADWLGKARELYDGFRYGRNTKALADMLTRPDAAKALSAIAKAGPHTAKAQGLAAIYLLNTAADQGRKAIAK